MGNKNEFELFSWSPILKGFLFYGASTFWPSQTKIMKLNLKSPEFNTISDYTLCLAPELHPHHWWKQILYNVHQVFSLSKQSWLGTYLLSSPVPLAESMLNKLCNIEPCSTNKQKRVWKMRTWSCHPRIYFLRRTDCSCQSSMCCILMSLNGFQKCAALVWRTRTFPEKTAQIVATINLPQHLYIHAHHVLCAACGSNCMVINFCVWHLRVCSLSTHNIKFWAFLSAHWLFWVTSISGPHGRDTQKSQRKRAHRIFLFLVLSVARRQ
jgi:hypothetical protein